MNSILKLAAVAFVAAFFAIMTTGCGHNVVTYSDGIGLETTINPETYTIGLNFRYGKILTATVKEKTEVNLEAGLKQKTGAESETGIDTKLNFKTGDQITGYVVELEKVKAAK